KARYPPAAGVGQEKGSGVEWHLRAELVCRRQLTANPMLVPCASSRWPLLRSLAAPAVLPFDPSVRLLDPVPGSVGTLSLRPTDVSPIGRPFACCSRPCPRPLALPAPSFSRSPPTAPLALPPVAGSVTGTVAAGVSHAAARPGS